MFGTGVGWGCRAGSSKGEGCVGVDWGVLLVVCSMCVGGRGCSSGVCRMIFLWERLFGGVGVGIRFVAHGVWCEGGNRGNGVRGNGEYGWRYSSEDMNE